MSRRTRPRVPHVFALVQVILRLGALGTALAELGVLIKLATEYHDVHNGKTFGGAISASVIAILVNLFEIPPLVDHTHKIKRPATCLVGLADLAVIAIGIYSIFEIGLSDYNLADAPSGTPAPWVVLQSHAFWLIIAVIAESVASLLLDCVSACREVMASKRESVTMIRLPTSEGREGRP